MTAQRPDPFDSTRPRESSHGQRMQERICAVIERAHRVRVADYEDSSREDAEELRRVVVELLRESLGALAVIEEHYERRGATPAGGILITGHGRGMLDTVDQHHSRPAGLEKIGDLIFIASLGLRSRLHAVETRPEAKDGWEVIADCSGAIREVLKSHSALERAICEWEALEPSSTYFGTELDRALRTRRAYTRLREEVYGCSVPTDGELQMRLRRTAAAIAKLVGREAYISARVEDRRMIRGAQRRIRSWLLEEPQEDGPSSVEERSTWRKEGGHLWRDIATLCDLVLGINHRAELRDHDADVFESALARLAGLPPAEPLQLRVALPELETVVGRDADVDALVQSSQAHPTLEVEEVLRRALRALRMTAPSSEPTGGVPF